MCPPEKFIYLGGLNLPQIGSLQHLLPKAVFADVAEDLERFGSRCATDVLQMHWDACNDTPVLQHFDPQGRRIDLLRTSTGWRQLKAVAADEGLIALAYERRHGEHSRVHWAAKMMLFGPSSAMYNCPLAMTDGAAHLIQAIDDQWTKDRALPAMLSRCPHSNQICGQWMTEKAGGSDVAASTETVATPLEVLTDDGMTHTLDGIKWFTSATDSSMALALARERGADGRLIPGNQGLALFFVEMRGEDGRLNNIEILRLKDKLGTRQLPTAELRLSGTKARKLSDTGRGIPTIGRMVNVRKQFPSFSFLFVLELSVFRVILPSLFFCQVRPRNSCSDGAGGDA